MGNCGAQGALATDCDLGEQELLDGLRVEAEALQAASQPRLDPLVQMRCRPGSPPPFAPAVHRELKHSLGRAVELLAR